MVVKVDKINRKIDWKPWREAFESAKTLDEKLEASADIFAHGKQEQWQFVNLSHYDTDGLMSSKLLHEYLRQGTSSIYSNPFERRGFEAYQLTKSGELEHKLTFDMKFLAKVNLGFIIVSTDLRFSDNYRRRLENLQELLDAPLVSIDHHAPKKRILDGEKFVDYFGFDDEKAIEWEKRDREQQKRGIKQPCLEINTQSYQYPSSLLVYEIIKKAAKRSEEPMHVGNLSPFAAVGIIGDKADLKVGTKFPRENALDTIKQAYQINNEQDIKCAADWMELISYSLPDLSRSLWQSLRVTKDVYDLCNNKKETIYRWGRTLSSERKRIMDKFWKRVTPGMKKRKVYSYGLGISEIELDGYKYNVNMAVPVVNKLSSMYRSDFFAIWTQKENTELFNSDRNSQIYKVYLRRSDGYANVKDIMRVMKDGYFEKEPKIKGCGPVGDVIFYTKDDLKKGLRKYMSKCTKLRAIEDHLESA